MSQSIIADNQPRKVALTQGETYFWCVCGRSKDQPFCDGSHRGTGFKPKRCVVEKSGDVYLCQCKQTGHPPFCDGTHKRFGKEQVGKPPGESS